MPAGRIVILNGAPRAGKSSIARALQAATDRLWVNLGVDILMAATPEHLHPGIGLRPGGERPDLEPHVKLLYAGLFEAIAAQARLGIDVVSDLGIHDDYATPLGIYEEARRRLEGFDVLWVGVKCPLDVIMARRNADPRGGFYVGGETPPAPVRRWQEAVHAGKSYDLEIDTSVSPPEAAATAILARLEGHG